MIGERFGQLVVTEVMRRDSRLLCACECDCGREKVVLKDNLVRGATKSCGHRLSIADRFWAKVRKAGPDDCWLWGAGIGSYGYGQFWEQGKGRTVQAHRIAWELTHGEIGEGLFVCHRCDNPPCVNPAHLFVGTPADNTADAARKGRMARGVRNGSHTRPERRRVGALNGSSKLTALQAAEIRTSDAPTGALARRFGVNRSTAQRIRAGKGWRVT